MSEVICVGQDGGRMFNTIEIFNQKVICNVDYDTLKQSLEKLIEEDEKFLQNAKMECNRIINGNFLEFNHNTSSLLLSFAAFVISLFGIERIPVSIGVYLLYVAIIVIVGIASVYLHKRKQNAEKIKFVIENR